MRQARIILVSVLVGALALGIGPVPAGAATGGAIIDSAACTENALPANDDRSSEKVALPFDVNFYGTIHDSLWVNNNGNVTFGGPLSTYRPFQLIAAGVPIIAPFFADVDTSVAPSDIVRYGYGETIFQGRNAFCVNWVNVGYFPDSTDKLNSFQLLLVDRPDQGDGAFDIIFNYDKIQWEAGSESGGSGGLGGRTARAGFASGAAILGASTELRGSGVAGSFLDSSPTGLIHDKQGSSINGRYVYLIRDQQMLADTYVALGDSYQSGEGAGSYDPETDKPSRYCHRSEYAYPELLVDRRDVRLKLKFRACSGALIADLDTSPAETGNLPWANGAPQLDALSAATKLVTVGIGGNDIGFVPIVKGCILLSWPNSEIITGPGGDLLLSGKTPCLNNQDDEVQAALERIESGTIHDDLQALYREIRERAPYARVVVVSYPRFFPVAGSGFATTCELLRVGDQQWMNDATGRANFAIGMKAISAGFDYINMEGVFEGHELCRYNSAMNGIKGLDTRFPEWLSPESFHPNQLGHSIMADEVAELLGKPVLPSFVIKPQETITRSLYVSGRSVHFNAAWPGSDVEMTLISPTGVRYDRITTHGADHGNGPTYEYFDINNPEKGTWTVEMFGADIAPEGEPITYTAVDQPMPNLKPSAVFTTTGSGATYKFDASASVDSDGTVDEYSWDFGDGTIAAGPVVEHTFPAGQEYRVILGVRDDDGAQDFVAGEQTVGTVGQRFGSSVALTNKVSLTGPVRVNGDFSCNNSGTIVGDLETTGNVYLTNNCRVEGSIRANGTVTIDSTPKVAGDIVASGAVRFQSTARVGGSVTTGGTFTVTDGKSVGYLTDNDIVAGTITAGAAVPAMEPMIQPAVVASAADWAGFTAQTWAEWMNATAVANAAPSWSQARTAKPGCTMAPWGASVNGSIVRVAADTLIDARQPGCPRVALHGMTMELAGDLTLFADGFDTVNGLKVRSTDGKAHTVTVIVPGSTVCSSPNSVTLSAGTTSGELGRIEVKVAGRLTVNGTATTRGNAVAGCFSANGTVLLGR